MRRNEIVAIWTRMGDPCTWITEGLWVITRYGCEKWGIDLRRLWCLLLKKHCYFSPPDTFQFKCEYIQTTVRKKTEGTCNFQAGHCLLSLQTFNPKTQNNAVLISCLIHLWNPIQWQKCTKVHQLTRPSCKVVNQKYLSFSLLVHGNNCAEQNACSFLYFTTWATKPLYEDTCAL